MGGGSGGGMSKGGGSYSVPTVPEYEAPEVVETEDGQETKETAAARAQQRKLAAQAKGRSSTILTGPQGDTSETPGTKNTLLGR